jgi:flagella basal body P-ring formation protein FlgA
MPCLKPGTELVANMLKIFISLLCITQSIFGTGFLDELKQFIKADLSQRIQVQDFNVSIDNWSDAMEKEKVPLDKLTVRDVTFQNDQRKYSIQIDGFTKGVLKFNGKIEWLADVPVLNRAISPGEKISDDDVTTQTANVDRLTALHIRDKADLVGKTAKNVLLKPGVILSKNDVQAPIIIKKGALTRIIYKKGSLQISTTAIATKDSHFGDQGVFEIIGQETSKAPKKTIYAVATDYNLARVGDTHDPL